MVLEKLCLEFAEKHNLVLVKDGNVLYAHRHPYEIMPKTEDGREYFRVKTEQENDCKVVLSPETRMLVIGISASASELGFDRLKKSSSVFCRAIYGQLASAPKDDRREAYYSEQQNDFQYEDIVAILAALYP